MGDHFLNSVYKTLNNMKDITKDGDQPFPFLLDYYNIYHYAEPELSPRHNTLSNIRNAVVQGLNEHKTKLPRLILMLPEDNILHFINYFAFGVSTISVDA